MSPAEKKAVTNIMRDRDVFRTYNNHIYVAHGFIQPPTKILSYLKYVPDPNGGWASPNGRYRRVFSGGPESVLSGMKIPDKSYLHYDMHFGVELLKVPVNDVLKHYRPEERLRDIIKNGPNDTLEERAKTIAEMLHDTLEIPFDRIGVAGSISWHGHDPSFSDVNMNVYGHDAINRLLSGKEKIVEEYPNIRFRTIEEWIAGTIARLCIRIPHITKDDLIPLFKRRREICINGIYTGVMPVLLPNEAPIKYGYESYHAIDYKPIGTRLEIIDAQFGSLTPAIYQTTSSPLDVIGGNRITRLMIYDGAFKDLLLPGDIVEVSGTIQRVTTKDSREFYQTMIGTMRGAGKEFLRLIDQSSDQGM